MTREELRESFMARRGPVSPERAEEFEEMLEGLIELTLELEKRKNEAQEKLEHFKRDAIQALADRVSVSSSKDSDWNDVAIIDFEFEDPTGLRVKSQASYSMHVISRATWDYLSDLVKGKEKLLVYYNPEEPQGTIVEYLWEGRIYESPYDVALAREEIPVRDYAMNTWKAAPEQDSIIVRHYFKTAVIKPQADARRMIFLVFGNIFSYGYSDFIRQAEEALSPETTEILIDITNMEIPWTGGFSKLVKDLSRVHLLFYGYPPPLGRPEVELRAKFAEQVETHGERMLAFVNEQVEKASEDFRIVDAGNKEYLSRLPDWSIG